MGKYEEQLRELEERHSEKMWDYQNMLLDRVTGLLKDRKVDIGMKTALGRVLGDVSFGLKRESTSGLTSVDRVAVVKTLLQNGQAISQMAENDRAFVLRVELLGNEIRKLGDEISDLERQQAEALARNDKALVKVLEKQKIKKHVNKK